MYHSFVSCFQNDFVPATLMTTYNFNDIDVVPKHLGGVLCIFTVTEHLGAKSLNKYGWVLRVTNLMCLYTKNLIVGNEV